MSVIFVLALPILFAAAAPAPEAPAVVVELFTSQGCSSCPPAEELLSEIGRDPGIVALAFHVDYWNDLGWADPFSSAAFSQRQRDYARVLGGGSYTPEAVVNGAAGMVGSHGGALRSAIAEAKAHPLAKIAVDVTAKDGAFSVHATTAVAGALWVAVVESRVSTTIARGENGGTSPKSDFVVRSLSALEGSESTLRLDKEWRRENVHLAVFVQDPKTRKIVAASAPTKLPAAP